MQVLLTAKKNKLLEQLIGFFPLPASKNLWGFGSQVQLSLLLSAVTPGWQFLPWRGLSTTLLPYFLPLGFLISVMKAFFISQQTLSNADITNKYQDKTWGKFLLFRFIELLAKTKWIHSQVAYIRDPTVQRLTQRFFLKSYAAVTITVRFLKITF